MHNIAIAVLLAVLFPAAAAAQICHGTADITSERPIQIGGEFSHSEIATGLGGSFVGGNSSVFGKVLFRHDNNHGEVTRNTKVLDLGGGFQLAADERRLVMCPEASVTRHFSSDEGPSGETVGVSAKVIGGGGSAGFVLGNGRVRVVPNAGIWIQRFWPDSDSPSASSRTVGIVRLGAGLVLSQRVSIVPIVGLPFRTPDGERYFALGLNFSLGE